MGSRDGRNGPAHMASSKRRSRPERPRREPLDDNYYYEEPPRGENSAGFQDITSYSSSRKRKEDQRELERQKGKQGMSRAKKAILITLAVLLVLVGGGLYYVFGYMLKDLTVKEITKDPVKLGIDDGSAVNGEANVPVVLDDSIKNIAMFGVDARDASFEGRSDVIMVLTVDNKHGKVKMTSIARDTCADIEGYGYDKITHAYAYGRDEGAELAINTLNRNFRAASLRITDYVTVNFAKMAEIVDACGGVDMELTADEVREININLWNLSVDVEEEVAMDQENGTFRDRSDYAYITNDDIIPDGYGEKNVDSDYYEGGKYHLNGNQAVAYGRIRHLDSDNVRMERQQNVLKALIQQVKGKSKLEYPEMIRKIMPMCETSLDFGDITAMLPILFTDFTIETLTLPGEAEQPQGAYIRSDCWVYLYDLEAAAKHISNFIYEKDSPYYGQEIIPGDPGVETVEGSGGDSYDSYSDDGGGMLSEPPVSSEPQDPVSDPSSSSWIEDPSSSSWTEDPSSSSWTEDPSSSSWTETSSSSSGGGGDSSWIEPNPDSSGGTVDDTGGGAEGTEDGAATGLEASADGAPDSVLSSESE